MDLSDSSDSIIYHSVNPGSKRTGCRIILVVILSYSLLADEPMGLSEAKGRYDK
jgi:hypothetical protein